MVVTRSAPQSAVNPQVPESSGRAEKQGAQECLEIPFRERQTNFDWNQSFWERNATRDGATDPSCPSLCSKTTLDSKTQIPEYPRRPTPRSELRGTNVNGLQSLGSGVYDVHPSVPVSTSKPPQDAWPCLLSQDLKAANGPDRHTLHNAQVTQRVDQEGLRSTSLDSHTFPFGAWRDVLVTVDANEEVHRCPEADSDGTSWEVVSACRSESEDDPRTDSCPENELDDSPTPSNTTSSDTAASQQDIPRSSSAFSRDVNDSASRGRRIVNWILGHRNIVLLRGSQPKLTTSAGYTSSAGSTASAWGISGLSQSSASNTGPSRVGEKRQSPAGNGNSRDGQGGGDPKRLRMADSSQTILRFACPFQKYDPQASRHCSQPSRRNAWGGFEDVHRVKQHVLNVHDKALFCHRCCRRWETPQHAREHEETANCEAIPTDRTDWMKPGQEKDVRKRIASKDPEDRWYTLFQRLFPHLPSEGPDSAREKYTPYYYAGAGSSVNCNMSSDESILSSSVGLFLDEPFAIYNTPPPQSMVSEHVATQEPSSLINTYSDYYTTDWLGDGLGNVNLQPASPRGANAFNGHNTTNPPLHKCFVFENSTSGNEIHDSKMANLSLMNPSLPLNDGQLTATNHADLRLHLSNSCDELRRRGSKIDRCLTAYSKLSACLDDMSNFAIELASNPADASRMRTLNAHIQLMRQVLANVF